MSLLSSPTTVDPVDTALYHILLIRPEPLVAFPPYDARVLCNALGLSYRVVVNSSNPRQMSVQMLPNTSPVPENSTVYFINNGVLMRNSEHVSFESLLQSLIMTIQRLTPHYVGPYRLPLRPLSFLWYSRSSTRLRYFWYRSCPLERWSEYQSRR